VRRSPLDAGGTIVARRPDGRGGGEITATVYQRRGIQLFSRNDNVERDVSPGKNFQPRSAKPTCVELDSGDESWRSKAWR
jgi:hypothetical protein